MGYQIVKRSGHIHTYRYNGYSSFTNEQIKKKNAGQFGLKILDANLGSGRSDAVLGWGNIGWDLVNKGERYGICSLTC